MAIELTPGDPYDAELVERARPPGWQDPTPAGRYNLVVLGAGTAGLGARVIHPYPTESEALKKVADDYNRTRLTPWARWLLGKWLA